MPKECCTYEAEAGVSRVLDPPSRDGLECGWRPACLEANNAVVCYSLGQYAIGRMLILAGLIADSHDGVEVVLS